MAQEQATVELGFDIAQLQGLMGAVQGKPEAGQTVWKANTTWAKGSGFRSEAQIRDFSVPMDEPDVLGGSNTAPNMVEMVLGAYGCCLTTGYVMNAGLRGIELEDVKIDLEADLDLNGFFDLKDGVWPGYTDVRAKVHLTAPAASPEQLRELHEHVTRTSPVGCILSRPVNVSAELQE
ncbi:MAG: OsmC family protein [Anaerolineae bacterium]